MKKYLLFFSLLLTLFLIASCSKNATGVNDKYPSGNMQGYVRDENGKALKGAKIFCLYPFSYFPNQYSPFQKTTKHQVQKDSAYTFTFIGNFPNPVYNTVYFRFSLGKDCMVALTLESKLNHQQFTLIQQSLEYGYYQFYFDNLVDSLKLQNGIYQLSFQASSNDKILLERTMTMNVISNLGIPNCTTDENGHFIFDFRKAFIGDTIPVRPFWSTRTYSYLTIENPIYFYAEKEGYHSKFFQTWIIEDLTIRHDIVLPTMSKKK